MPFAGVTGTLIDPPKYNYFSLGKNILRIPITPVVTVVDDIIIYADYDGKELKGSGISATGNSINIQSGKHFKIGSNDLTYSDIGAAPTIHTHDAADIISGVLNPARLGSGIADSTKYLRFDGSWSPLTERSIKDLGVVNIVSGTNTIDSTSLSAANAVRWYYTLTGGMGVNLSYSGYLMAVWNSAGTLNYTNVSTPTAGNVDPLTNGEVFLSVIVDTGTNSVKFVTTTTATSNLYQINVKRMFT